MKCKLLKKPKKHFILIDLRDVIIMLRKCNFLHIEQFFERKVYEKSGKDDFRNANCSIAFWNAADNFNIVGRAFFSVY